MPSKGLTDTHTLVAVSMGRPSGIKRKKEAARELAQRKDSDVSRTKVSVDTFKELVKEITSNQNAALNLLKENSLGWGDKGYRLVANKILPKILKDLEAARTTHDRVSREASERLLLQVRRDAKGQSEGGLGDLFDASDYPSQEEFVSKCSFVVDLDTVPDASQDVRAGFSPEHQERLRSALSSQHASKVQDAVRELNGRLESTLRKLVDRMKEYDGGQKGSFRDSLMGNVRELAGLLDGMNITGDPAIEEARIRMIRDLCTVEASDLREDEALRDRVATAATDILTRVGNFGGKND